MHQENNTGTETSYVIWGYIMRNVMCKTWSVTIPYYSILVSLECCLGVIRRPGMKEISSLQVINYEKKLNSHVILIEKQD